MKDTIYILTCAIGLLSCTDQTKENTVVSKPANNAQTITTNSKNTDTLQTIHTEQKQQPTPGKAKSVGEADLSAYDLRNYIDNKTYKIVLDSQDYYEDPYFKQGTDSIVYHCHKSIIYDKWIFHKSNYGNEKIGYLNANESEARSFEAALFDASYYAWHQNGKISKIGNYKKSELNGVWKQYDEKGHLQFKGQFENGKLIQCHPCDSVSLYSDLTVKSYRCIF